MGNFRCVNVNVEPAQVARDDTARGMRSILSSLASSARLLGDDFPRRVWPDILQQSGPDAALKDLLIEWCLANPTPLVLLVDEIDSLVGDTLLSVLRQLRAGYQRRPEGFPQSVVLCGVRDIRDYRIRSSAGEVIAGGSPFNVAAKSLRMGDFTEAETRALIAQHTEETGQRFSPARSSGAWSRRWATWPGAGRRKGIWWCSTAVARARRTAGAATAKWMEAVAGRTAAGWWSGRCSALAGEHGTMRTTRCSGRQPSETGRLTSPGSVGSSVFGPPWPGRIGPTMVGHRSSSVRTGRPELAGAILDRLVHNACKLELYSREAPCDNSAPGCRHMPIIAWHNHHPAPLRSEW